jgi:arsenate reductase
MEVSSKKKILFLCTGNSTRSQMAEGLVRHFREEEFESFSAGIDPKGVHPKALETMEEISIDISCQHSKHLDEIKNIEFDYVITLCDHAEKNCPLFFTKGKRIHKAFSDPAAVKGKDDDITSSFRVVRDQLREYILDFTDDEDDIA